MQQRTNATPHTQDLLPSLSIWLVPHLLSAPSGWQLVQALDGMDLPRLMHMAENMHVSAAAASHDYVAHHVVVYVKMHDH
jgi:hypothetical protein